MKNGKTKDTFNLSWSQLKAEILSTKNWLIKLDENDLKTIEGNEAICMQVFEATTVSKEATRLKDLSNSILVQIKNSVEPNMSSITLLMMVQFPEHAVATIEEMNYINDLVEEILQSCSECEIKWGTSSREDNITRIVCAVR